MLLNIRFILKMLGVMFILETFFMLLASAVAFFYREGDESVLLLSAGILFLTGLLCYGIGFRANEHNVGKREGMLIVTFTWIMFSFFGMLPFYLGGYIDNVTDAYFETMSGFTTTGSTILRDIEVLPKGILFWRSLTQWQGGIGIIVFTVALLPIFGGGASLMFEAETSGITKDRFLPRITQVAKRIWGVYVTLTCILVFLLWIGPMNLFDAVNHALTAISTGGYSTKNASVAYWDSAYVDYILSLFMFIGATNMSLVYFCFNGKVKRLFEDEEFRFYAIFTLTVILITVGWLLYLGIVDDFWEGLRTATFQVVTLITTCGFATDDFIPWGPFFWFIALILMLVCGCAGSTSGGVKIGRVVVLIKMLFNQFKKQTHPNAIVPVRVNGRVVSSEAVHRVMAFVFVYITLILFGCFLFALDGMGFEESLSMSVSSLSNVGPGLGSVGPIYNFAHVPDFSKWLMSFLMLVGRLELFTVLTILLPSFWKQ